MTLNVEKKKEIINTIGKDDKDTGSSRIQIALLTERIRGLTEHCKIHKKDNHSRYGLVKLVSKRKKHLKYLRRTGPGDYSKLIKELKIRG
jgi:small subunit ribosomal protein S15